MALVRSAQFHTEISSYGSLVGIVSFIVTIWFIKTLSSINTTLQEIRHLLAQQAYNKTATQTGSTSSPTLPSPRPREELSLQWSD